MFLYDIRLTRAVAAFAAITLAVAAWAQPLPVAKPETVGMSSQKLAKISQALKKEVDDGSFRGAVIMVARKGKLVYQDAIGMQTASAKMTRDSVFRIYSMTKPLVSVAAMMLVEDGTIQLTDPVSKYLPGFDKLQVSVAGKNDAGSTTYTLVPQERQMTVQDLLRHTSGLAYGEITQNAPVKEGLQKIGVYYPDFDFNARNLAPADQIAKMATVPLAFQPGTTWHYSLASDMLGRVVERASGKRLGDFLRGAPVRAAQDGGLRVLGAGGEDAAPRRIAGEGPLRRPRLPADRRVRAADERFGRRGRRVDRVRLPALLADDDERRHAERRARAQPHHGEADDRRTTSAARWPWRRRPVNC